MAAQNNQNSKKTEKLCKKIRNAVSSPFRSRISSSISQTTENPIISSPKKTKPLPVFHQPSLSKMIPVELETPSAAKSSPHKTKKSGQSAGKENSNITGKRGNDFGGREILIVNGKKIAKREDPKPSKNVSFGKAKSKKHGDDDNDDSLHEGKFSDYISRVRERMLKTASSIGGGGGTFPGRDSFSDKVTDYINHAKTKIRTTTNVADEKGVSHN